MRYEGVCLINETTINIEYQNSDPQVSWYGVCLSDGDDFNNFLIKDVSSRLYDEEGNEDLKTHLLGLASTGFAQESLKEILSAEIQEERDWAIGEAIAEAYLCQKHNITWPWNMERDKRTPKSSLQGADLVGFEVNDGNVRLVLGEVKTSSDGSTPPAVMNGRSGMIHQIDNLASNLSVIFQVLKWLQPRCKMTEHEAHFNEAISLLLESGNKAFALFGVLIRDTPPNELDCCARAQSLVERLQYPTTCQLVVIYLPCAITDLPARVLGGAS